MEKNIKTLKLEVKKLRKKKDILNNQEELAVSELKEKIVNLRIENDIPSISIISSSDSDELKKAKELIVNLQKEVRKIENQYELKEVLIDREISTLKLQIAELELEEMDKEEPKSNNNNIFEEMQKELDSLMD
jgi:hypothetical protein